MDSYGFIKDKPHIIKAKLRLAELAEQLGEIVRERAEALKHLQDDE